jgi:putative Mg2+ transporter-C (MgtC) family protein
MPTTNEILIRLLLGAFIGGTIGFERQIHGRPAGFRTHILVCIAAVLIMLVSEYYQFRNSIDPSYVRIDPGRIAAGALAGVGFIGAGVVLKTGVSIQGLTTAACIWVVSAIGLAIGSGLYLAGAVAFLITIFTLSILRIAERKMPKLMHRFLDITADMNADEAQIKAIIEKYGLTVENIDYEHCTDIGQTKFYFTVSFYHYRSLKKLADDLSSLEFVRKVCLKTGKNAQK